MEETYWSLGAAVPKLCPADFKRAFEKRILWSAMIEKHCMLHPPSQESHNTKDHVGGSETLLLGTLLGGLTVLCAALGLRHASAWWPEGTCAGAATTVFLLMGVPLWGSQSGFFPVENHG